MEKQISRESVEKELRDLRWDLNEAQKKAWEYEQEVIAIKDDIEVREILLNRMSKKPKQTNRV